MGQRPQLGRLRALMGMAGALLLSWGAPSAQAQPPGPEACQACHAGYVATFEASIHGKKGHPRTPANAGGCAVCHGDGTEHVKAGGGRGVGGIRNLGSKQLPAEEKSAVCLGCHADNRHLAFWDSGRHRKNDVSCINCHNTHGGGPALLRSDDPSITPFVTTSRQLEHETCTACHRDIRAQMHRPSHHPLLEGRIKCSSCHNPHGALSPSMVNNESTRDLCLSCHADKRGPFIFEHPPVEENCLSCHNPHGSRSVKLLREKVPNLCQDCHDASQHPGTAWDPGDSFTGATPSTRFFARACLNCHNEIHGSNAPASRGRRFVR
jgi:DmsE family decaheme c-type cytochrome